MYTGALENHRDLVRRLERLRPLWGNGAAVLAAVRSPRRVADILTAVDLPCPLVRLPPDLPPDRGRWLLKPQAGAAGVGIRSWNGQALPESRRHKVYLQEFIEGENGSALFLATGQGNHGDQGETRLLGITRQLVGEVWLGAGPFRYCGSIGPLSGADTTRETLERLGTVLADATGLRGLFGVDFVLREGVPWPVEVNPRYTASVEVLEYGTGLRALAPHHRVFGSATTVSVEGEVVGKAILFARSPLRFPEDGPWMAALRSSASIEEMPAFADIPPAGQVIEAGRPVLTFFARAGGVTECLEALRRIAADLDARLFGR
jgi:predicted ATP-grasp superfamily ATP-dependent carboligase